MRTDEPGAGASTTAPDPNNQAKQTRDPEGRPYVVQRRGIDGTAGWSVTAAAEWTDIATVTVQPRTQRTTIVLQAIKEAGIRPDLTDRFRVLDEEVAQELAVSKKEPAEPEYIVRAVPIGD